MKLDYTPQQLAEMANTLRMDVVDSIHCARSGHPGGSLSAAEMLAVLYFREMDIDPEKPDWAGRDRFVLSKGHAAPVYYAALARRGYFPVEDLKTLRKIGSPLQGHPDRKKVRGVDMSTGSLGQGISAAAGMACYAKKNGDDFRVYCVLGDGEMQEGEVWEAFQFAYAHKLDNLIYFIDKNGYQLDGPTDDILPHGDIAKKAASFGLYTQEIDGHDVQAIYDAIQNAYANKGVPSCIVLDTCKGKGATFAEPKHDHSSQPNEEQWAEAIAASEQALEAIKNA